MGGRIMLTRLLSSVFVLAFLLGGATVALEALGLIFHDGPVDPGQRAEDAIAKIEASLDPRDLPSEAEAQGLWPPPDEQPTKAKQAVGDHDGEPPSAVAVGSALTVRVVTETEPETGAETGPETGPEAKPEVPDPVPPRPTSVAVVETPGKAVAPAPELEPEPGAIRGAKACAEPCNAKPPAQKRARPSRASGKVGCPLSGWLGG
jgi:phosphatidylglycerol---prolipoprotein diacylglyceryl transferase